MLRRLVLPIAVCIGASLQAQQPASPALALTADQKCALNAIDEAAKLKAAPAAMRFATVAREVNRNILADHPDEALRQKLAAELKEAAFQLLSLKGDSVRQAVAILTPEQKARLKTEMLKPDAPADLTELIRKLF